MSDPGIERSRANGFILEKNDKRRMFCVGALGAEVIPVERVLAIFHFPFFLSLAKKEWEKKESADPASLRSMGAPPSAEPTGACFATPPARWKPLRRAEQARPLRGSELISLVGEAFEASRQVRRAPNGAPKRAARAAMRGYRIIDPSDFGERFFLSSIFLAREERPWARRRRR